MAVKVYFTEEVERVLREKLPKTRGALTLFVEEAVREKMEKLGWL